MVASFSRWVIARGFAQTNASHAPGSCDRAAKDGAAAAGGTIKQKQLLDDMMMGVGSRPDESSHYCGGVPSQK